jgi:hypothetical protein
MALMLVVCPRMEMRADGRFTGISIYSFETSGYTRITDFGQRAPGSKMVVDCCSPEVSHVTQRST